MKRRFTLFFILIVLITIAIKLDFKLNRYSSDALINFNSIENTVASQKLNSNNFYLDKLDKTSYVAHRGAISNKPENSIIAFRTAKDMGFDIVETDLHLTKDGQWILMHDYTLDRTTTGKGVVRNYTLEEIRSYKLKDTESKIDGQDLLIPTLDEFLKLCSDLELSPILDIKPNEKQISPKAYISLIDSLSKYDLLDKSIICSYSKGVLSEIRKMKKNVTIAVMMDITKDTIEFTKDLDNAFIYYNYKEMSVDKLKLLEKNNLKYGVWTIDGKEDADYFKSKGTIMIVTDMLLPDEE